MNFIRYLENPISYIIIFLIDNIKKIISYIIYILYKKSIIDSEENLKEI